MRSIWRIGGRGWEFHGKLGLGGIHGGGKSVLQLRRGWGGNVRVWELRGSVGSVAIGLDWAGGVLAVHGRGEAAKQS